MMTVRYRRSAVFDSKVKTTPEIDADLAEIDSINLWFKNNKADVKIAGPKFTRRADLHMKVRAYFQDKLGTDFIVIGWVNDATPAETTFRGDCRTRSEPRKKRDDHHDLGGSD